MEKQTITIPAACNSILKKVASRLYQRLDETDNDLRFIGEEIDDNEISAIRIKLYNTMQKSLDQLQDLVKNKESRAWHQFIPLLRRFWLVRVAGKDKPFAAVHPYCLNNSNNVLSCLVCNLTKDVCKYSGGIQTEHINLFSDNIWGRELLFEEITKETFKEYINKSVESVFDYREMRYQQECADGEITE